MQRGEPWKGWVNTIEYTTVFLYFDWLCLLWHGLKLSIRERTS